MNGRLAASQFVAKLRDELHSSIYVGSMFDFDYAAKYCKTGGQEVWVSGQIMSPMDSGHGLTQIYRQRADVQIAIRIISARHSDGVLDPEQAFIDLFDSVSAVICGWQPEGADLPMTWKGFMDGSPADSVLYSDLMFRAPVTYSRNVV